MRCQSCGTMNEPGFRFCGSCGARHESAVPAAGGAGGAAAMGGQQLVSDGVGVVAPAIARPRRMTDAGGRADESLALPRRSKAPLVALLAVDAALAVGGALLLRAGLAGSAVADAATAPSATDAGAGKGAAVKAEGTSEAAASAASSTTEAPSGEPSGGAKGEGAAAVATSEPPSAAAPSAAPEDAADRGAAAAEPEAPKGLAPGEPTPGAGPDKTVEKNEKSDAAARKKKEKRSAAADGPVDPYAPAPDLSSQINKLFAKGQSKLDKCYASIVRQGPTQLTVSFSVMPDGSLGGIQVVRVSTGAEMLGVCVQAELAKWKVKSGASGAFIRSIQFR